MFKADMAEQKKKLMQMLALVVQGLDQPETILPAVRSLGQRHSEYGVQDEHYAAVGEALLWTLELGLGQGFTPAVRDAWTEAYSMLANSMKEGSRPLVVDPTN
jgi:nitric oxide dioxygenase